MDRIKLYEAATNTEAMNEIKAACSNMRNCIRKYAGGKANASAKNEMLEGMRKIEADLKAVVKSSVKTGKKVNESYAPNANLIQRARALFNFNTGMSYDDAMEEKEYANVYQVCIGDPELEGYEIEVGDGFADCMAWNDAWGEMVQNTDFNNWFENLGEAIVEAKNTSKILGCFVIITDDDFIPMRFFYDGEEL